MSRPPLTSFSTMDALNQEELCSPRALALHHLASLGLHPGRFNYVAMYNNEMISLSPSLINGSFPDVL